MIGSLIQMTEKAKKILITTETVEVTTIQRSRRVDVRKYCFECSRQVEMLSIDAAVIVTGIRSLELFRLLESERVHFVESTQGQVLICEPSLMHVARPDITTSRLQIVECELNLERNTDE